MKASPKKQIESSKKISIIQEMKKQQLKNIQRLYQEGKNLMEYFRNQDNTQQNSTEAILISYDFQAGSYVQYAQEHAEYLDQYTGAIAKILDQFSGSSLLEVGVGEATTLNNVLSRLKNKPQIAYGFDLSWSRIKHAQQYTLNFEHKDLVHLVTGDLFQAPFADDSIDLVYTSHSIEPNGGREAEALEELYRITKKYLVLLEPGYELASEEARARMQRHGYITNLKATAEKLNYNIIEHRLMDYYANPLNPTALMIIEKKTEASRQSTALACPVTKAKLDKNADSYFCPASFLAYPIVQGIPCLLPENALVASHYSNFD